MLTKKYDSCEWVIGIGTPESVISVRVYWDSSEGGSWFLYRGKFCFGGVEYGLKIDGSDRCLNVSFDDARAAARAALKKLGVDDPLDRDATYRRALWTVWRFRDGKEWASQTIEAPELGGRLRWEVVTDGVKLSGLQNIWEEAINALQKATSLALPLVPQLLPHGVSRSF